MLYALVFVYFITLILQPQNLTFVHLSKHYITSSFKGIHRTENQDSYLVIDDPDYSLYAVFDGVGGAENGREASHLAKKFVKENFSRYINGKVKVKELLYDLNNALATSEYCEAYSTYCLLVIKKSTGMIYYSWLGDSRIYEVNNQFIEPITEDDSDGTNIITKFLGDDELTPDDIRLLSFKKDNKHLLLCTDGFYHILESDKFTFFKEFQRKSLDSVKTKIKSLVRGKNADDSTFIFVR